MMNVLIRFNDDGTRAAVSATVAKTAYGGAHLLRPGESYRGVPYRVWQSYVDDEVDALSLLHWANNPGMAAATWAADAPPPDVHRGLIPQPTTLLQALLQGILLVGIPYAILTAIAREIDQPGPGFDTGRFTDVLTARLLIGIVFMGPLVGLCLWHKRHRADRTG
jgi:hypothetical protein